jgi:hypothetical protein
LRSFPEIPEIKPHFIGALTSIMALFNVYVFHIELIAHVECEILMAMIMESESG